MAPVITSANPIIDMEGLFILRSNQLITFSMDMYNLYLVVIFQMLTQFGDIHIHRTGIDVVVVYPDGFQSKVTLKYLIGMTAKQSQQLVFFRGQFGLFFTDAEELFLCIEYKATDMIYRPLLVLLATYTAQDSLYTEHKFFHREWFGDIVVCTYLKTFEDIFFQRLGCQEDNRDFGVSLSDFLCECETIFLWHHHIKHTDVELRFEESLIAFFAICTKFCYITFCCQILAKQHAQVLIVFTKKNFQIFVHSSLIFYDW